MREKRKERVCVLALCTWEIKQISDVYSDSDLATYMRRCVCVCISVRREWGRVGWGFILIRIVIYKRKFYFFVSREMWDVRFWGNLHHVDARKLVRPPLPPKLAHEIQLFPPQCTSHLLIYVYSYWVGQPLLNLLYQDKQHVQDAYAVAQVRGSSSTAKFLSHSPRSPYLWVASAKVEAIKWSA